MTRPVRLRFAPSPTGKLHVGGARTALFNWAYARRHGGEFLLRVEDTDPERSKPEYETAILEGLRWLGIEWDEGPDVGGAFGPYRQSERAERYLAVATALYKAGWAYRCFCPPERLTELREGQRARGETPRYDGHCRDLDDAEAKARMEAGERPVLRFRVPEGETRFQDLIRGDVTFQNAEVDDWVMVRADGTPTYNFVVVCDDAAMEITHVFRGEEHLTNTPKQVLLYNALGLDQPSFGHFPLMLGKDKKKLSKRTGDTALQDYRDNGYPPEAVLNFLALQGWALDDKTDVFSAEQLVANFDIRSVSKAGAIFDPDKFLWMSGEYLRADSVERIADRALPYLVERGLVAAADVEPGGPKRDWYVAAVALVQERISLYADVPDKLAWLFAADDAVEYAEKAEKNAKKHGPEHLTAYLDWLRPRVESGVDAAALRDATKEWIGEHGLKFPMLFQPLRCALTGEPGGPDLFDTMTALGAESTLARIEAGLGRLG
ncbi:MAG: glutamate--tRNA ligase [Planctomycetota bacterium]